MVCLIWRGQTPAERTFSRILKADMLALHSELKVKERESPESEVFYFQSDRDSVSFHD